MVLCWSVYHLSGLLKNPVGRAKCPALWRISYVPIEAGIYPASKVDFFNMTFRQIRFKAFCLFSQAGILRTSHKGLPEGHAYADASVILKPFWFNLERKFTVRANCRRSVQSMSTINPDKGCPSFYIVVGNRKLMNPLIIVYLNH
jgi:hypothetical protein